MTITPVAGPSSICNVGDRERPLRGTFALGDGEVHGAGMDEQLIPDTAEAEAPALRALAREILEAEAAHLGVSLDDADIVPRRAEGIPAVHITAAADELLEHLAAIEGTALPDRGIIAVLARAGAQMLMSAVELDGG